jgi:hypothetical protein
MPVGLENKFELYTCPLYHCTQKMDFYAQQSARLASGEIRDHGHPFDYGLGFMVNYIDYTTGKRHTEVEYLETKEEHDEQRYVVEWYVNGEKTYTVSTVRAKNIYDLAVPGEAFIASGNNTWHVLMRQAAMERIQQLGRYEEMVLCYQDKLHNHDVERIVVRNEPYPDLAYD